MPILRVAVWCGLWSRNYLAVNEEEAINGTVNGDTYRIMIANDVDPALHRRYLLFTEWSNFPYISGRNRFSVQPSDGHLIVLNDEVSWSPKSCYLTLLHYFLWNVV